MPPSNLPNTGRRPDFLPCRGAAIPAVAARSSVARRAWRRLLFALLALSGLPVRAQSQAPASPASPPWAELERYAFTYVHPGSQLKDHIYERSRGFFALGDAQRDALRTPEEVRRRQEEIRRVVVANLGGRPGAQTPLNPRVTGTVEGDGFRIEKIIFESQPRHYVTANLYLPTQRSGRTGAVLFLSGHHATAKVVPEYQVVCQTLARAGLIVLSQDPVGQGERLSYYDVEAKRPLVPIGTRDHDTAGAQQRFLGDTLARYMLHDAMRGIDYLLTRPEVDPAKIGVTGNSGGGTQSSLVMLVDPRVAAAAPATFIMNRDTYQRTGQPQDAEQIWSGFTRAGFDHEDILLAMAPKPVCVLAVTSDFFPIEGTRRTVTRARRIWELYSHGSALELVEDETTHTYTVKLARAAAVFFARHLLGRAVDLSGFEAKPFPGEQLWCTKSGQVRAEFADAEFVFDETRVRLREAEAARNAVEPGERQARAREWLRTQVFRDRPLTPLNTRWHARGRNVGDYTVEIAFWWTQPELANLGMLIRPRGKSLAGLPVTVAIWDDGTAALSRHADWIAAECGRGRAVFVVNLSGMGPMKADPVNQGPMHDFYGTWHKLSDDLDWMGDSLVALRTFEAVRAVEALGQWPELNRADVRFHGRGRMGVHARLAAALEPRVTGCEWPDAFRFTDFVHARSYDTKDVKSYILPGVLRHFDLDEL